MSDSATAGDRPVAGFDGAPATVVSLPGTHRPPAVELERIARTFVLGGEPVHALRDVSETLDTGEHVAIMGPSGSGKSTLLNIIGCLDRPTSGSYRLGGREVAGLAERELDAIRQQRIGFIFQTFHLVPRLTALGNVELPMIFAGLGRAERRQRAAAVLEAVGLTPRAAHRPAELSGGERQRLAIARALAMRPAMLLADEPTGNLDSRSGGVVLDLLDQLNRQGLTLVTVTHDPRVARRANRTVILADGAIVRRAARHELPAALADWGLGETAR